MHLLNKNVLEDLNPFLKNFVINDICENQSLNTYDKEEKEEKKENQTILQQNWKT